MRSTLRPSPMDLTCSPYPPHPLIHSRQLRSQLLSPAAHLGPREVAGENKPCSKAKLAKKTTLKDSAQ
ncbi:hypothetical protein NQZ68_030932 [Dissostichus eleginoides]|nr:hypothetical protein NQZ68_030932 [Dissostichus eleginoides]